MGLKNSKNSIKDQLSEAELNALCLSTKMSKAEIIKWHKGFMLDCPSGRLSKQEFLKIYEQLFPSGRATRFCETVFNVFDKEKTNTIDFTEFIVACSLTSRGKTMDKLKVSFQVYDDSDSNGIVSRDEMLKIIDAVYQLYEGVPSGSDDSIKRVNLIIDKFDRDKNGSVTKTEFIQGCLDDPKIKTALNRQESNRSLK